MLFSGLEERLNSTLEIARKETVERGEQIEIEVRFKTAAGIGEAGIKSEEAFQRSLRLFTAHVRENNSEWSPVPSSGRPETDVVKYYSNNIRSIQKKDENTKRFERKTPIAGSPIFLTPYVWPMTINIAGENTNIQEEFAIPVENGATRTRTRWSFVHSRHLKADFKVDFTWTKFVKDDHEKLEFEIEIEASPDAVFEDFKKVNDEYVYSAQHIAINDTFMTIMKFVYNTPILYSLSLKHQVIRSINAAFNPASTNTTLIQIPEHFINKPRTLQWRDFDRNTPFSLFPPEGSSDGNAVFAVTIKTDGVRVFVYYHSSGIYLFNPLGDMMIRISEKSPVSLIGSMLDGELLPTSRYTVNDTVFSVWVFDCLFVNLLDVQQKDEIMDFRSWPLMQRLKPMRFVCKVQNANNDEVPPGGIRLVLNPKEHIPFHDRQTFYNANTRALALNMPNKVKLFESDGLIYTDMGPYLRDLAPSCKCRYRNKNCKQCRGYNPSINRKFKPVELLTVDFIVKFSDAEVLQLHSGITPGVTIPFTGTEEMSVDSTQFVHEFYDGNTLIQIEPNKIYEFRWDKSAAMWIPLRHRVDRLEPNGIDNARSNWNVIHNDIPLGTLTGKSKGKKALHLMRVYQNHVKSITLSHWATEVKIGLSLKHDKRKPRLFDIGSGYGGDVKKWKAADFNVYALEPDSERVESIISRATEIGIKERIEVLEMKIQEYDKLEGKIEKTLLEKADVVTSFHSMTLVYDSAASIKAFIRSVKSVLKIGGTFVCMAMDGAAVHAQLGPYKQLTMEGIKIQRSKDDPRKIMVKMVTSDASLARGQSEYLVDFDYLIANLEAEGFELIFDRHLTTAALLSDSELWWSQMTRMIEMRYMGVKVLRKSDEKLQAVSNILSGTMRSAQVETDQIIEVSTKSMRDIGADEDEKFWLVGTLAGGSSLFHSLLWCVDNAYRKAKGDVNFRFDRVFKLRNELAARMQSEDIPDNMLRDTGVFSLTSCKESMAEYTSHCGNFMIPFIETTLDINIHILSWVDDQLIPMRNMTSSFVNERTNVILHSTSNGRFEPIGRSLAGQGHLASFVFDSGDSIITNLLKYKQ
jgi:hypothetical protein